MTRPRTPPTMPFLTIAWMVALVGVLVTPHPDPVFAGYWSGPGGHRAGLPGTSGGSPAASGDVVWLDDGDDDDDDDDDDSRIAAYDELAPSTAWRAAIGLDRLRDSHDGDDVTVAVIDTGVRRTPDVADDIVARVDLTPDGDGRDYYGHGTHMAGIIAGDGSGSGGRWRGVAPEADIASVKVAGWDGATDVSAIIAAIQWVVSHRQEHGIRVLNLSFGTDATQSYLVDPLDRAVERAWQAGILVVTAAGNDGASGGPVSKPGDDPFVLTVGATDVNGTATLADDTVALFSSRGRTIDGVEKPDLVAPGTTIVATRAPGSTVDTLRPEGRVGSSHFKGTGTSQAAAVVSGVAALLFEADPSLTPDEAKAVLMGTANALPGQLGSGAGQVDAAAALAAVRAGAAWHRTSTDELLAATGTGTLDASRGSHRVYVDADGDGIPEALGGEIDALGLAFDALAWTNAPWTAASWKESPWAAVTCVARRWWLQPLCGVSSWRGMAWDSEWWGSQTWIPAGWVQKSWTNKSWTQKSWTTGHWN